MTDTLKAQPYDGTPEVPPRPGRNYRPADLLLLPGILTLLRIPLAVAFVFAASRPALALGVLFAAGLSDVLDGWLARRFAQTTPMGAIADGITDKLFFSVVVLTLFWTGRLSLPSVALLGARDLGELPLLAWVGLSQARRTKLGDTPPSANLPGKLATFLQFATLTSLLLGSTRSTLTSGLLLSAAAVGAVAAGLYWARTISALRSPAST